MAKRPPLAGVLEVTAPPITCTVQLDDVDRRLLVLLAADARVSQRKLAMELGMSPPAVGERISRLERAGVILGYTVKVGWSALGYVSVYLTVTAIQGADQAAMLKALHALPEVEDIVLISGSMDMLARMRVRDHEHLRRLLLSDIWQMAGVQRTETFLCLAEMPEKYRFVAEVLRPDPPETAAGGDEGRAGPPDRRAARRGAGSRA